MTIFTRTFWLKSRKWLIGGGAVMLITGAIAFGSSKTKLDTRLDKNDADHVQIASDLECAKNKDAKTDAVITGINVKLDDLTKDMAEVKIDIREIRNLLVQRDRTAKGGLARDNSPFSAQNVQTVEKQ